MEHGEQLFLKNKYIRFYDIITLRKFLHITEEETESITSSNNAKKLVQDEIIMDYEPSFFQDLVSFLATTRTEENQCIFSLQNWSPNSIAYEIIPGTYEVSDNENSSDALEKVYVSSNLILNSVQSSSARILLFHNLIVNIKVIQLWKFGVPRSFW